MDTIKICKPITMVPLSKRRLLYSLVQIYNLHLDELVFQNLFSISYIYFSISYIHIKTLNTISNQHTFLYNTYTKLLILLAQLGVLSLLQQLGNIVRLCCSSLSALWR